MKTTRVYIQLLPNELHEITLEEAAALRLNVSAGCQNGKSQRSPVQGKSELPRPTDRASQSCSDPEKHVFQPLESTERQQLCMLAPEHDSLWPNHSSQGTLEPPAELPGLRWDLAHSDEPSAHQTAGKEDIAFQTCFSFLQISSFACSHRKGQYKEKKNSKIFFLVQGYFWHLELQIL